MRWLLPPFQRLVKRSPAVSESSPRRLLQQLRQVLGGEVASKARQRAATASRSPRPPGALIPPPPPAARTRPATAPPAAAPAPSPPRPVPARGDAANCRRARRPGGVGRPDSSSWLHSLVTPPFLAPAGWQAKTPATPEEANMDSKRDRRKRCLALSRLAVDLLRLIESIGRIWDQLVR